MQGVELAMSSAYHSQSNGQTELVNRSLEQYPRAFVGDKPRKWVEWLPLAEFLFNTNYHIATKFTPFEALYAFKLWMIGFSLGSNPLNNSLFDGTK